MAEIRCRLCTRSSRKSDSFHLFCSINVGLLQKVETLTGIKIKNSPNAPECMCQYCKRELERAYRFRKICLRAQTYFEHTNRRKLKKRQKMTVTEKLEENTSIYEEERFFLYDLKAEEKDKKDLVDSFPSHTSSTIVDCIEEHIEDDHEQEQLISLQIEGGSGDIDKAYDFETITTDDLELCEEEEEEEGDDNVSGSEMKCDYSTIAESILNNRSTNTRKASHKKSKYKRPDPGTVYICELCGAVFSYLASISEHMKRHKKDKPFKCRYCIKCFCTKPELVRHEMVHTGEKPFKCKDCGKAFSRQSTLYDHVLCLHSNVRPYLCRFCGNGFATSKYLKRHEQQHTGERPFECSVCNVKFQRNSFLNTHYRSKTHERNAAQLQQL